MINPQELAAVEGFSCVGWTISKITLTSMEQRLCEYLAEALRTRYGCFCTGKRLRQIDNSPLTVIVNKFLESK